MRCASNHAPPLGAAHHVEGVRVDCDVALHREAVQDGLLLCVPLLCSLWVLKQRSRRVCVLCAPA